MLEHHGHESGNPASDISNEHYETDLFQSFWISLFFLSSLYSWAWDVYMDWGLGLPEVCVIKRLLASKLLQFCTNDFLVELYYLAVWIFRSETNVFSEKSLLRGYRSRSFPTVRCYSVPSMQMF